MSQSLRRSLLAVLVAGLFATVGFAADDELKEKALKLNELTGNEAMDNQLRLFVKDKDNTKKLLAVAVVMAKEKEQPFNYNAAFILARTSQLLKEPKTSEVFYRIAVEKAIAVQSATKLVQVYDGLIDLFYENNKYDDAIKICQEFLDLPGNERIQRLKPFVMERLIQAKAKQGKTEDALKLTQNLIDADEDGWYFVQLKAWVLREDGKLEDAAKTYLDVLKRLRKADIEDEPREKFTERVRYLLSSVYVDLKKIDQAAEQLQILIKKHPDHATYNNDLGYIWADHDMNLDEAEVLIQKAIDEDRKFRKALTELPAEFNKDNPAYLDSLGWVKFKKKEFGEAKKYLLQAVEDKDGQHIEILDHLADTHLALKEVKEAIAVWEQSLKMEATTPREKLRRTEIEAKLKKYKDN